MLQVIKRLAQKTKNYTSNFSTVLVALILGSFIAACSPKSESIAPASELNSIASARVDNVITDSTLTLKSVASFPIGVALNSKLLTSNTKVNNIVLKEFNSRTVPMYMNIEWSKGKFNFSEMDYSVKSAEINPIRLHGHCLVYHIAAPEWLTKFNGSTIEFESAVKNHIQMIVSRYKGKVKSWDVINEIIDYKTGKISNNEFRKMYNNDEDYLTFVKNCFKWAHEADPSALLFWNEDVYEISPLKQATMLTIVDNFKRSGTPINGLGTQLHINVTTSNDGIRTSILKLASTGLLIHVSELDVAINPGKDNNLNISSSLLNVQQSKYQTVAILYKQLVPPAQQYGITLWGLDDNDSWLLSSTNQREMPCLFDNQYNKKAVYYSFLNALK